MILGRGQGCFGETVGQDLKDLLEPRFQECWGAQELHSAAALGEQEEVGAKRALKPGQGPQTVHQYVPAFLQRAIAEDNGVHS